MGAALVLVALLQARPVSAWLLFEHDRIGGAGVRRLGGADRAALQAAWQVAIQGRGRAARRYCPAFGAVLSAESVRSSEDWCVGFSALGALAGDHACVPDEIGQAVEDLDWVGPLLVESRDRQRSMDALDVHDVTGRTIAWREHNVAVQGIDPGLVPRAQNNRSHFLPALDVATEPRTSDASARIATTLHEYLRRALAPGARVNAVTMYVHYHALALREASGACALRDGVPHCGPQGSARLWRAFLAEAFAIHFLEDSFSTGHIVGTWGDLGQRLGSHDHYSTRGLDVRTWSGRLYTGHGDAFLSRQDESVAAGAIASSLAQLANALRTHEPGALGALARRADPRAARYSACDRTLRTPVGLAAAAREPLVTEVLRQLPIPTSRDHGLARFRSEVGAFLGFVLEGNGFGVFGAGSGLASSDARLRLGVGAGFALEGAFARFMDGRFFVDAMLVLSMHEYAVGRRAIGFGARLRMPFFLLPGDAIYLVIPATLFDSELGYTMGTTAADGGLGGLQRQVILAENVSFQFMLGREVTAVWFPHLGWQLDVPVIELRGDRLFTGAFATESALQIGGTLTWHENARAVGIFVSFAERVRRYMPQSCDDGCD